MLSVYFSYLYVLDLYLALIGISSASVIDAPGGTALF